MEQDCRLQYDSRLIEVGPRFFNSDEWEVRPAEVRQGEIAGGAVNSALERFQDRYTLSALLRGRRSLGSRRLECIPLGTAILKPL